MNTRRLFLTLALVATLGAALLPATAAADDASVFAAYTGHDAEFVKLGKQYRRADRRARKHKGGATDAQLQAIAGIDRKINALTGVVVADMNGQQPSSPGGERAKAYALQGIDLFVKGAEFDAQSCEQLIAHEVKMSDATFKKSIRAYKRAARYSKRAAKEFRRLGLK